ncbi:MAG TPA: type IV toxin-antitoxin system AbiEi family antitoxin domain-containing protein [Trebonia sp.]|jgi:hypothetical protein
MPVTPVYDRERLNRVLVEQFGVVSRAQALECGVSRGRLDHLVRPGGRWQRILPGVYVINTGAVSTDQRAMAALLYAGPKSLLTGAAAVRRHRLQCAGLNQVDVLVPEGVRVRSAGYVRIIRTGRMPEKCCRTQRIRFVLLPRAVADATRPMTSLGDVRAVVAEAVQKGRCDLAALIAELNDGPVAGSRLYRVALRECFAGSRSAAEGDLMTLMGRSDLPEPMYNAELYTADGTFLGVADLWWQRAGVVAEVDSRRYHLGPADYERTVMRHNRMAAHGINVLHFLPDTVKTDPSTVIRNLRGAIRTGSARPPVPIVAKPSTPASAVAGGRL